MAIDRTQYNLLVDDDGSGTTGSVMDKVDWKNVVLDPIDAMIVCTPTSYTPTWGNSGTANSLGNGSIAGAWSKIDKLTFFRITLTWGSSTASGNGAWSFTLPTASDAQGASIGLGGVLAFDSSASQSYAGFFTNSSTTVILPMTNANPIASYTSAAPFTWAVGDVVQVSGWYYAA